METNEENKVNNETPMETTNESGVANESAVELSTTPVAENVTVPEAVVESTPVAEVEESYFAEAHEEMPVAPELHEAAADEEHVEMLEEEHQHDFNVAGLDKQQLVALLEEAVGEDNIQSVSAKVKLIRDAFIDLAKAETDAKRAKHLEDGGEKDDFEMPKDAADDRFKKLSAVFNKKRADLKVKREMQILENTTTKKHIIEELKDLMKNEDNITKAYQKFQALQSKWRSVGPVVPSESNHLWQSYQFIAGQFFDVMKINKELKELDIKKNLEVKAELCEQAEKVSEEKSINRAISGVRNLQGKWKEIGFTGKDEASELVWQRFKAAIDKVYERFKEYNEKQKVTQEDNLKAKIELCNQLDEINNGTYATHTEWQLANDKVTKVWEKWQKVSYVPKSDNNASWNRFKIARQKFFDSKEVFYNGAKEELNKNLALKIALCEKAETLMTSTDWNTTTNDYKRMQAEWKRIGHIPRKLSDKTWARFKKACDTYFKNKENHFAEQDAVIIKNFDLKMEVIGRLNSLEVNEDNRVNLEAMKKLQEEFRTIGEVPYNKFETLAKEYRKAVDGYFGKIKGMNGTEEKAIHALKYEQMQQSPQGKEEMMKERGQIQDRIKRLQAEVNQIENNLSFFGNSGKSNPMLAEYQQKIEKGNAEIKKLKEQLKLIPVE